MPRYARFEANGFTFRFTVEPNHPEMLHIYARHLVRPEDVVALWEDPETVDVWNEERQRYESSNASHTLYWNWSRGGIGTVIVVYSCFRNGEEAR